MSIFPLWGNRRRLLAAPSTSIRFQTYGKVAPQKSEKEIAFSVTRFFQTNGSFQNYYMYHGGTNFGRSAGGPFITTTYDYHAPLDEYGLLNQPKWGHLKELHQVLRLCEQALITGRDAEQIFYGQQNVFIFSNGTENCAAFLSNMDKYANATIQFNGYIYDLPPSSVSILPDCKNVAFNSAKVRVQTNLMQMVPMNLKSLKSTDSGELQAWEWYYEPIGAWGETIVTTNCCLEQLRTTKDITDYLWYLTSVEISWDEGFSMNENHAVLEIPSVGNAAHIFVNGRLTASVAGDYQDRIAKVKQPIELQTGSNQIAILSMTVGLQDDSPVGRVDV